MSVVASIFYKSPIGFSVKNMVNNTDALDIDYNEMETDISLRDTTTMTAVKFNDLCSGGSSFAMDIKTKILSDEHKSELLASVNSDLPVSEHWVNISFPFDEVAYAKSIKDGNLTIGADTGWVNGGVIQFVFLFKNTTLGINKHVGLYYTMVGEAAI